MRNVHLHPLLLVHLALLAPLSAAGCTQATAPLCERQPDDPACTGGVDGGGVDGGGADGGGVDGGPCGGACGGATPLCRLSDEVCVSCLSDGDCAEASAAKCDLGSGSCVACDDSAQCAGVAAGEVCESGGCVECVDNSTCGAGSGCELSTHSCRAFTAASAGLCESCVRDAECQVGMLCAPMSYDDPRTGAIDPVAAGQHCLYRQDTTGSGTPNGDCTTWRLYVRESAVTSADGVSAMVCALTLSTCAAQADFRNVDCMSLDAAGDARCGDPLLDDAVCRMFGATTNRCTTFCGSHDDCRSGFTCNTTVIPPVCNL